MTGGWMWCRLLFLALLVINPVLSDVGTATSVGQNNAVVAQNLVETERMVAPARQVIPQPRISVGQTQLAPASKTSIPTTTLSMSLLQALARHKDDPSGIMFPIGIVLIALWFIMLVMQHNRNVPFMGRLIMMILGSVGFMIVILAISDNSDMEHIVFGLMVCLIVSFFLSRQAEENYQKRMHFANDSEDSEDDSEGKPKKPRKASVAEIRAEPLDFTGDEETFMSEYMKKMYAEKGYLILKGKHNRGKRCAEIACGPPKSAAGTSSTDPADWDPTAYLSACVSRSDPDFNGEVTENRPIADIRNHYLLLNYLLLVVDPQANRRLKMAGTSVSGKVTGKSFNTASIFKHVITMFASMKECQDQFK